MTIKQMEKEDILFFQSQNLYNEILKYFNDYDDGNPTSIDFSTAAAYIIQLEKNLKKLMMTSYVGDSDVALWYEDLAAFKNQKNKQEWSIGLNAAKDWMLNSYNNYSRSKGFSTIIGPKGVDNFIKFVLRYDNIDIYKNIIKRIITRQMTSASLYRTINSVIFQSNDRIEDSIEFEFDKKISLNESSFSNVFDSSTINYAENEENKDKAYIEKLKEEFEEYVEDKIDSVFRLYGLNNNLVLHSDEDYDDFRDNLVNTKDTILVQYNDQNKWIPEYEEILNRLFKEAYDKGDLITIDYDEDEGNMYYDEEGNWDPCDTDEYLDEGFSNIFDSSGVDYATHFEEKDLNYLKQPVKNFLDNEGITNYTINNDLTVNVDGNVNLKGCDKEYLPIKFNMVNGDFICTDSNLKSLDGFPRIINGNLYAAFSKISNIENYKMTIRKDCDFSNCPIEWFDINDMKILVYGNFWCGKTGKLDIIK